MTSKSWSIPETVAAVGVILSLIFVGVEIRHNTAAARGATYQAISDLASTGVLELALSEDYPRLRALIRDTDPPLSDLVPEDRERLQAIYMYTVHRIENVWVQVNEGIVDESAFTRFMPPPEFVAARAFRGFWELTRPGRASDFVAFLEGRYPALRLD
jgi:hypothetical protein